MPTWTECFVSTILVISFTSVAAIHVRGFWFFQTGVQSDASYRKVAHEMRAEGRHGPIAAVGPGAAYASLYLAYHLDEPYVGQYLGKMPTNVDAILEEFGVETLLVSAKGKRSTTFRNRTSWKSVREVHLNDEWMYIYTPP